MPAARIWSTYEGACSTLLPSPETVAAFRRMLPLESNSRPTCIAGAAAVVHLAAIPAPGIRSAAETFRINTLSTYNVFAAAVATGRSPSGTETRPSRAGWRSRVEG